jgi:hypothetical protein
MMDVLKEGGRHVNVVAHIIMIVHSNAKPRGTIIDVL